jgi:hypothetical protein
MAALGVLVAFAAITTAWFIPDGYEQTYRHGHPICCGHEIDRGPLRTLVAVLGTTGAVVLVLGGVLPRRRRQTPPSAVHT